MAILQERRIIITLLLLLFINGGRTSMVFVIENQCKHSVWVDSLPSLNITNFEVKPDQFIDIFAKPDSWRGRLWFRTHYTTDNTTGRFSCLTGNCDSGVEACNGNSPDAPFTSLEVLDRFPLEYGLNLQNGFNVPIAVSPVQAGPKPCPPSSCTGDIYQVCLRFLQVKGLDGAIIGCKSDCDASGDPKDCCEKGYGELGVCQPSASASLFKEVCPTAHTWKYDSWISPCNGASFKLVLCP